MRYKAKDIANWFIGRAKKDYDDDTKGGEMITHLKLQKLLYFAQGCYLVIKDEPLFDEKIYAWTFGPVVKDIYEEYRKYDGNVIGEYDAVDIDPETESILEEVYDVFGEYTAWALSNMTHEHTPWIDHKDAGDEMTQDEIKGYFDGNIVS